MRSSLDRRVKRFGEGGRIVLGGDPTGLFRLSAAGARALDAAADAADAVDAGECMESAASAAALVDHLVERGVLHPVPVPADGPFTASDVTVVVPVRDNAEGVARLLDSLAAPDPRGDSRDPRVAEVIVVDDGSTDATSIDEDAVDLPVRVVRREHNGGPAAARNTGAAQVTTPLIAFVDSDCTVSAGWLDGLLGHFADPAVAAVAPRVTPPATPVLFADSVAIATESANRTGYERARSPLDLGDDPAQVRPGGRISYVPSAALVVRADALRALGGFDEELRTGEDVDLTWRLIDAGHRVRYEPATVVEHAVRPTLGGFARQRFGYGRSAAPLDARHPRQVAPARLSRWSAAIAVLLLVGGPGVPVAAALAGWSTWKLRDRLDGVPTGEVVRLGLGGHWSAIRQLLRTSLRLWWPLLVPASVVSRRARRVLGLSLAQALFEASRDGVPVGSLPLVVLDDVAYGAGVWWGCVDERSGRVLLPELTVGSNSPT